MWANPIVAPDMTMLQYCLRARDLIPLGIFTALMALNLPRGIKLQLNNNNNNDFNLGLKQNLLTRQSLFWAHMIYAIIMILNANETNFAKNIKLCNGIYKPECWYKIGIT